MLTTSNALANWLEDVRERGVTVRLAGDRVRLGPRDCVTLADLDFVRAHREALIDVLSDDEMDTLAVAVAPTPVAPDPSGDVIGDGPAGHREGLRGEAFGEAYVVERDEEGHLCRRFGPRSRVIYSEHPDDNPLRWMGQAQRAGEPRRRDDD